MDSLSDPQTTIRAELDRMRQRLPTVYIILRSSENLTLSLFREASIAGMMDKGSVWICGPDIITLLDSTLNTSFISNHMQGIIGIEPYINELEPEYSRFYTEFQQAFRSEYEKNNEISFTPGVYALRAYDGLHAISSAANRSQVNGNTLMENLQASSFTGLIGLVRPRTNPSNKEEGTCSNFRVVNVVGKSYKEIGYWSEGFGFYKDQFQLSLRGSTLQQLTVVIWPGEANTIPGGLRKLIVCVPINSPEYAAYGFLKVDNKTNTYDGFCMDVFTAALERLSYSILFEFVPFTINANHITFDDLLDQVYFKVYHINSLSTNSVYIIRSNLYFIIAYIYAHNNIYDITITSSRSEKVSFTEPFIESGLTMIVPLKHKNAGLLITKPFHWKLWITFFILLISNFCAIWYLEKDFNAEVGFNGPWKEQLGTTFWIVGNTIFQNHGERIGNNYTRVVIISWLLVVLIVSNCFTANLSSILVTEKLKPVVDMSMVGSQNVTFINKYVENVLNFKNIKKIKFLEEFPRAFENGTITAAIMESPYARIFFYLSIKTMLSTEARRCLEDLVLHFRKTIH
ncbi:glutamate receptor 2.3-like [Carex rostrata]